MPQAVDDARYAAREARAGICHAKSKRIAAANLDRNSRFFGKPGQRMRKGHNEAIEIRAGDVFKMAARDNAAIQRHLDHAEVLVHRLFAG
ncbi:hypothetical protein SDC9_113969 [bioreactor metagenome]|uniref:Uncharacterized protein n=1 Tax=bioreactor metagenome TaxID=1076179 RepID=A0A645BUZ5_9ZZZZ